MIDKKGSARTRSIMMLKAMLVMSPLLLAGCSGGGNNSAATATSSVTAPTQTAAFTAQQFATQLSSSSYNAIDDNFNPATGTYDINKGKTILSLASGGTGTLTCGVTAYHVKYDTVGGANEAINDSAALLVPTGSSPACSGPRPIVLYAHGTETVKNYDMSNLNTPMDDRVLMVAAMFAANGYIVVAPNYAGYDTSTLAYHPYHNANQESQDMIDALLASRAILSTKAGGITSVSDNGKLFITGHSEGGYVAMATHRAMQQAGMTVTASAPSSGAYSLAAMGDMILYGYEDEGATTLIQMVITDFHHSYQNNASIGDVYYLTGQPTDVYSSNWLSVNVGSTAQSIDGLFPGVGTDSAVMMASGQYPLAILNSAPPTASDIPSGTPTAVTSALTALFPTISPPTNTGTGLDSLFAASFGANPLLKNSFRAAGLADALANPDGAFPKQSSLLTAAAPQFALRKALKMNDLRGWTPSSPSQNIQMCGGHNDPEVFFQINTALMSAIWSAQGVPAVAPYKDVDPFPNLASNSAASNAALPNIVQQIGTAAAIALVVDVSYNGRTTAAQLASDIPAMVTNPQFLASNPSLSTLLAVINSSDPMVQGFVADIPNAVASSLTTASVSGAISQALGTAPLTAANAQNATLDAAIGGLAGQGVLLSYHADLVAPVCHAEALNYFNKFN